MHISDHHISGYNLFVSAYHATLQKPIGKRGHPKWYDGAVDFAKLDLSRCEEIEVDKGRLLGLYVSSWSSVSEMRNIMPDLTTACLPSSENSWFTGTHHSLSSISPRSPARNWEYLSQYHPAGRSSITLICSIDLFACSVCKRTLEVRFSKMMQLMF